MRVVVDRDHVDGLVGRLCAQYDCHPVVSAGEGRGSKTLTFQPGDEAAYEWTKANASLEYRYYVVEFQATGERLAGDELVLHGPFGTEVDAMDWGNDHLGDNYRVASLKGPATDRPDWRRT